MIADHGRSVPNNVSKNGMIESTIQHQVHKSFDGILGLDPYHI